MEQTDKLDFAEMMAEWERRNAALVAAIRNAEETGSKLSNTKTDLDNKKAKLKADQESAAEAAKLRPEEFKQRAAVFNASIDAVDEAQTAFDMAGKDNDQAQTNFALRQNEFDEIDALVKKHLNIETLVSLGQELKEARDRAASAEQAPKEKEEVIREITRLPTEQEIEAFLLSEKGKKMIDAKAKPSSEMKKEHEALTQMVAWYESPAGIRELLQTDAGKVVLDEIKKEIKKPEQAPAFDPAKIDQKQMAKIPMKTITAFIIDNAGNVEIQAAIDTIRPKKSWMSLSFLDKKEKRIKKE